MARPLVFALLLLLPALVHAPAAELEEIQTKVFVVSPYFLGGDEAKFPKTPKGLIDLREYLKIREIELPGNGEAVYDPPAHRIVVKAPEDMLDQIMGLWQEYVPNTIRAVFTIVEFSAADAVDFPDLGYAELRKLAGNSWRVLDRVTLVGKSGQKFVIDMLGKKEPPGKNSVPPKAKGKEEEPDFFNAPISVNQFGTRVEVEPQIGPDGVTVDLSFEYVHRSRAAADQPPMVIRCQSNASLTHNVPLVVQTGTYAPPKGDSSHAPAKEWAVVVQVSVLDGYGRSLTLEPPATTEGPAPAQR